MAAGVVKLKQVAQDGVRVRASAGAGSFRRKEKLEGYLEAARASMTDAEATVMKPVLSEVEGMGDGGFRPAYNPQLASDADSWVIVGVDVATVGSDQGRMVPRVAQVIERCGPAPAGGWRLCRARADRPGEPTHRRLWAGARTEGQEDRFAPGQDERQRSGGRLAATDGHRRSEGHLQAAGGDGRMRQCA